MSSRNQEIEKMMDELGGKVCLVTAGSRTLGAEIACKMARSGEHLIVNYHQSKGYIGRARETSYNCNAKRPPGHARGNCQGCLRAMFADV